MALTELMLRKDNVLLLDEPTNHLDMDSREVLEDALADFPGTILAVSHDRYFINRFAERVWVMEEEGLREYLGNYDDYFARVSRDLPPDGEEQRMTRTALEKEKKKSREEQRRSKERKDKLKALEKEIAETEAEAARLEKRLGEADLWLQPEEAERITRAWRGEKEKADRLYEAWAAMEEEGIDTPGSV